MALTNNKNVLAWVDEMVALTKPDKVVWIDGSKEQLDALTEEVTSLPEGNRDKMYKLNPEKLPGCLYHRTLPNDVARVEDRTFICTKKKEDAGPTNNWMAPDEMKAKLVPLYDGVMKGRTMYVIPYSMGPIGSPLAKVGVELTDSIYVVLNMNIMTRMGKQAFENLGDVSNDFVRGLHSRLTLIRKTVISYSSRKKTQSGRSTPLTAVTFCWARSASLCVSLPSRVRMKAGWLNTCSSWAFRSRLVKLFISLLHSRLLAVRPTWLC